MANYGPEIVVGTGENSVGSLAEKSLVPTTARNFFIFEVELVAECLQDWEMLGI